MLLTKVFDALVSSHNRDVLSVLLGACGSSTGHLSARLNHKQLSFVALELWEPDVASSRGTPKILSMCWICGNVNVFCALHHKGYVHNLIHERQLNDLLDASG